MARFYVTTPIYYVNDVPHLGTAYTTIVADVLARYHRLIGDDTRFLTGTDEHGQKIEQAATAKNISPATFVDEASGRFRAAFVGDSNGSPLNCQPDDFIRTTEERHRVVVQDLWRKARANGFIYEGTYKGHYCIGCEAFYTEKELDQEAGQFLCKTHKTVCDVVEEPTFFFKLSALQDRLLKFYDSHPSFIAPEGRRNEVLSFVRAGLEDLSVSRVSFTWGIPVPDVERHVTYVWFDALTNYLSALGPEGDPRRAYWPPTVQLLGKDILRFHAVYWPAFLLAAGFSEDQLPQRLFAHGWLTINGQKMSKSLRNVVEPLKLAEAFGADTVRFYLLREVAFGQDGDFNHGQLIARYNSELADAIGNLLQRTLGLCTKLRVNVQLDAKTSWSALEDKLAETAKTTLIAYRASFEELAPHRAVDAFLALARAANKYIDESAPWAEAKKANAEGNGRLDVILSATLEVLRHLSVLVWPVMPTVSRKLRAQLGLPELTAPSGHEGPDQLALTFAPDFHTGRFATAEPIFPKIDHERQVAIFAELGVSTASPDVDESAATKKPDGSKKVKEFPAAASEITFEEFTRMDLRIGEVRTAERVAKSDKLLKLLVDVGEAYPRQIVAGLGKSFSPEQLIGKQVLVVANLKPAKLMGLESRGMVLATGVDESQLALMTPGQPRVIGSRVK